ncbi:MAG: hypothetical protein RLZZ488_716 [Pseudomonadota bacterium]
MNAPVPNCGRNLLTLQRKRPKIPVTPTRFRGVTLSRIVFCDADLRAKLHYAHIDAIELGAGDCSYDVIEDQPTSAICQEMAEDDTCYYITDPVGLLNAVSKHGLVTDHRTILLLSEKDNSLLSPISEQLGNLRYILGAPTPSLLRGFIASILEFGLSKQIRGVVPRLLNPTGLHTRSTVLTDTTKRSSVQEAVIEFFNEQLQVHKSSLVNGISSYPKYMGDVVDEFLMNAIWDAHPIRRTTDRSVPPQLDEGEKIEIDCHCDGANLTLSVTDHHGSFPSSAVVKPIRYALGFKDEPQLNEGPGGAGLGLLMTLQKVAALSIEVEAGQLTRSVAVLRGDQPLREMQRRPRSVLVFEKR